MTSKINVILKTLCLLLAAQCFFISCNDNGNLGLDLVPNKNDFLFSDTLSISMMTMEDDSSITGFNPLTGSFLGSFILGSSTTKKYGQSKAGFVTAFTLDKANVSFGDNFRYDSLIMILSYNGFYGDSSTTFRINVYELDENLDIDTLYYSNTNVKVKPGLIGSFTYTPKPYSRSYFYSLEADSITAQSSQLRIPISNLVGERIAAASGTADLLDDESFSNFFKGIYVEVEQVASNGCFMYFSPTNGITQLSMYYTNFDGDTSTRIFPFLINTKTPRFNKYYHNYANSRAGENLNKVDPEGGNLYVESMAGLKVKLDFPTLNAFVANNHIAINRAELVLRYTDDGLPFNALPASLFIVKTDSLNRKVTLPFTGEQTGSLNFSAGTYTLNITNYLQKYLYEADKYGFYILPSSGNVTANRVSFGASNNLNYKPVLKLYYTKVK